LSYTEEGTFFHSFLEAFISLNEGREEQALAMFYELLEKNLLPREKALVYYFLGDINDRLNNKQEAIEFFAKAALIDVKTSTKETLAIIRLSELLFERDDLRNALAFIQKANQDADFYGAQHRKIQVGAILPLIEEKIIIRIEEQRERLYRQTLIVSFLLIFVIFLVVVVYLQVRRLKSARRALLQAHKSLQKVNVQLTDVNEGIRQKNLEVGKMNHQLLEANKIKEEYIGFFFTQDAEIFEKFRSLKSQVEKDLEFGNIEKAKHTLGSYDLKREKEKLLTDFDEAFIKLFPNFIKEFNSLLKEEEQITVKKGQILNKELRIFALIRLGIRHNEIIAQILGYSVNSIYAYKTKIRKKSILDNKDFDQKLIENSTLQL
jgi:tetratricopeptide (TPR) repeat protein